MRGRTTGRRPRLRAAALAGAGVIAGMMAGSADATWLRASSRHFIVYADADAAALQKQAAELETFDAVLRHVQHVPDQPDTAFNKVTVYVLPSISAVQAVGRMGSVAGFYLPRVTGSVAFTPKAGDGGDANGFTPRIVLFHEYTHHFLLGNFTGAYPAWFSEGYAEFASTMLEKDGSYWLGAPAQHRAYILTAAGRTLTAAQLFAPPAKMNDLQQEALYGRGWLLTHMTQFDPALSKQFHQYIKALNAGTPSPKAATDAFGDLKQLDRHMDAYLGQSRIPALMIKTGTLPHAEIAIRPLTSGEAALIRLRMESTRGVSGKTAGPLYQRAKSQSARLVGDAVAQGWLAEMAYDAGDDVGAEAAANAALAVDPVSSQALLYKARLRLRRLVAAKSTDADAWKEARSWILKANRVSPDDAAALALFYESFDMQGVPPMKGAVAGLFRAVELVPQDTGLRFAAARQFLIDGNADQAKAMLRPLAYDPHAGVDNAAARLLAALEAGVDVRAALEALRQASGDAAKGGQAGE